MTLLGLVTVALILAALVGAACKLCPRLLNLWLMELGAVRRDGWDPPTVGCRVTPEDPDDELDPAEPRVVRVSGTHRAVLYVPRGADLYRVTAALSLQAEARGWEPAGITRDWTELMRLLGDGAYQLGVVPSVGDLDPERLPRVVGADELAADDAAARGGPAPSPRRGRRPRRLRPEQRWQT